MKLSTILFAALLSFPAFAAKVVVDVPAGVTHCGFYLDASAVPSVVAANTSALTCTYDVQSVTVGAHIVNADTRRADPIWGTLISAKSTVNYPFTKPAGNATASEATNFRLVP